jgi:hypothetical protein
VIIKDKLAEFAADVKVLLNHTIKEAFILGLVGLE